MNESSYATPPAAGPSGGITPNGSVTPTERKRAQASTGVGIVFVGEGQGWFTSVNARERGKRSKDEPGDGTPPESTADPTSSAL